MDKQHQEYFTTALIQGKKEKVCLGEICDKCGRCKYCEKDCLPPTKQRILDNLTPAQEQKLQDKHAKTYTGTDDNMPDDFDRWLEDLSSKDISNLIK